MSPLLRGAPRAAGGRLTWFAVGAPAPELGDGCVEHEVLPDDRWPPYVSRRGGRWRSPNLRATAPRVAPVSPLAAPPVPSPGAPRAPGGPPGDRTARSGDPPSSLCVRARARA